MANTLFSSKDKHVRLWDAVGGVCTNTMTDCLGEIASVEFDDEGKYLLVGCKDNSNRLWDLRMVSVSNKFRCTILIPLSATQRVPLHGTSKYLKESRAL